MRYTIHGFSQPKALELGLDNDDLLILRYFVDFKDSGAMVSKIIEGKVYYWIKYEAILEQLPILKLKKDSVYRKLKKMCSTNVLEHKTIKKNGTYSFYSIGKGYIELVSNSNPNNLDNKGTDLNPNGVRKQIREGTDLNPDQKINLLKDSSNNSSCSSKGNMEVFKKFEQCGFGLLSPVMLEKISADIEVYGSDWVMRAAEKADEAGKHRYDYVKGILENWKADGGIKEKKRVEVNGNRRNFKDKNKKKSTFNNFKQRDYDFKDLERKLLGWED